MKSYLLNTNIFIILLVTMCFVWVLLRLEEMTALSNPKGDYDLFLKHLDRYYITNKVYTIFVNIFYFILTIAPFILLRYLNLGTSTTVIHINDYVIYHTIIYFGVLVVIYSLYHYILSKLFLKEVIKLHIYLYYRFWQYEDFIWFCERYLNPGLKIIENLRTIFNRILDKALDKEYDKIRTNYYILRFIRLCQYFCLRYKIMLGIIKICRRVVIILSNLHHLISSVIPEFTLISLFFYEFFYLQLFYYIYYYLFVYLFVFLYRRFRRFLDSFSEISLYILNNYFYANKISYAYQRPSILQGMSELYNTFINVALRDEFRSNKNSYISFVTKGSSFGGSEDSQFISKLRLRAKKQHREVLLLFILTLLMIVITSSLIEPFYIKIILLVLNSYAWFFMLFDNLTPADEYARYKKIGKIIYVIIVIIQGYINWKLLIKPTLFFMETEIVWDWIITIKKTYTIEDKVMYIYQYYDYYINMVGDITEGEKEHIRGIIREIDFMQLVDDKTTLKELQVYVKLLIDTYIANEIFIEVVKKAIIASIEEVRAGPYHIYDIMNDILYFIQMQLTRLHVIPVLAWSLGITIFYEIMASGTTALEYYMGDVEDVIITPAAALFNQQVLESYWQIILQHYSWILVALGIVNILWNKPSTEEEEVIRPVCTIEDYHVLLLYPDYISRLYCYLFALYCIISFIRTLLLLLFYYFHEK